VDIGVAGVLVDAEWAFRPWLSRIRVAALPRFRGLDDARWRSPLDHRRGRRRSGPGSHATFSEMDA
jgi:hypothetical protein